MPVCSSGRGGAKDHYLKTRIVLFFAGAFARSTNARMDALLMLPAQKQHCPLDE